MKRLALATAIIFALASAILAADLSINTALQFSRSNATVQASDQSSVTTSNSYFVNVVVAASTATNQLSLGAVVSPGWVQVSNMSALTNPVPKLYISADAGTNEVLELYPRETVAFRWNAAAIWYRASTNMDAVFRVFNR